MPTRTARRPTTRAPRKPKSAPCQGCGGPKDRNVKGARFCQACTDARLPVAQRQVLDRALREAASVPKAKGAKRVVRVNEAGKVWCSGHRAYLPAARFTRARNPAGYAYHCRSCVASRGHEARIKAQFGLTLAAYNALLDLQGGRCAICPARPAKQRLAVDHDHRTGAVRGLLCKRCNHDLLGAAHDSVAMLRRAISYLEAPPAQTGAPVPVVGESDPTVGALLGSRRQRPPRRRAS
jgi:Recombination endonuclease VII